MNKLKKGTYNPTYPIKDLKLAKINRDISTNHSENFTSKLIEYGWLMPIVISKNGDVIEGHHRIESAKILKQKTIPVYIIDWVNTKQEREHLQCFNRS